MYRRPRPPQEAAEGSSLLDLLARYVRLAAPGAVLAAMAVAGYVRVFGSLAPYDDEGAFLISLQGFLDGATLYEDLFSQYGPVLFFAEGGLFALLGLELNSDMARLFALTEWLAVSAGCAALTARLTGSPALALGALVTTFAALTGLVNEPLHPGGLLCLLLVAILACAAFVAPRRPAAALVVMGALGAAAALTKINVGGLALIALALAVVLHVPALRRLRVAACAAAVLLPFALTAPDLTVPGTRDLALLVALATLAVLLAGRPRDPALAPRALAALVAGAGAMTLLVAGATVALGTSLADLFDGVVLRPTGQREAFGVPLDPSPGAVELALVAAAVASVLWLRRATTGPGRPLAEGIARVAAGVVVWSALAGGGDLLGLASREGIGTIGVVLSLLWVAAVPSRNAPACSLGFARTLLPLLAVLQGLHAYPVAGTQIDYATFLGVPAGALMLSDGAADLRTWAAGAADRAALVRQVLAVGAVALVAKVAYAGMLVPGIEFGQAYRLNPSLGLPGYARLHVAPAVAEPLRWLARELPARCDTFITYPGYNSLHVITGIAPPTRLNVTGWMTLLTDGEQQRVVAALERTPRACAVRNRALIDFWQRGEPVRRGPLVRYIEGRFRPIGRRGDFELMVRA